MRYRTLKLAITCFSLLLAAGTAEAAVIFDDGSGHQLFDSDVGFFDSPTTDIDFTEAGLPGLGVVFPSATAVDGDGSQTTFTAVGGSTLAIQNTTSNVLFPYSISTTGTVEITFDLANGPVNRFGFSFWADPASPIRIQAFSGATEIFHSPEPGYTSSPDPKFYGFNSDEAFTHVWVHNHGGQFSIGEIRAEAGALVPEPGSLAIWSALGLGLVGFGWRRRK
jgi:hypothetical protein